MKIYLYIIFQLTSRTMCIGLRATKEEPIDNIKDAKVITYQYYSPGNLRLTCIAVIKLQDFQLC